MAAVKKVLGLLVVIFLCWVTQAEGKLSVEKKDHTVDGVCKSTLEIAGNGVRDSFQVPCEDANRMLVREWSNGFAVGHPGSDPVCAYSPQKSTLIFIKKQGLFCSKKTFDAYVRVKSEDPNVLHCSEIARQAAMSLES